MRKNAFRIIALYFLVIYLLITLPPLFSYPFFHRENDAPVGLQRQTAPAFAETIQRLHPITASTSVANSDIFRIFDADAGKIIAVPNKEFLFGTLACEMSPTVPEEALKAQAVAAYSYYSRIRQERTSKEYDFSWDSKTSFPYAPKEVLLEKWGENADTLEEKLNSVIDSVYGQVLTYENAIACTAYFASSNGKTESAETVWGKDYPYLRSVASPYDTLAPGYESTKKISPEEIRKKMEQRWPDARYNFDLPYSDWFSELTYTLGATVVSVKICGFSITGVEARSVFGLKSATFTVEYQDDSFLFRTKGSGHGVGMSQTGAIYMAAEGADYQEILNWYYPGTELRL